MESCGLKVTKTNNFLNNSTNRHSPEQDLLDKSKHMLRILNIKVLKLFYLQKEKEDNDETLCTFLDENDCRFYYVYYFDNDKKEVIKAQRDLEYPPKVLFFGIIFSIVAAIVLMGMAILLLWKLLTTIHDKREFARFEKERMMAKWGGSENPIYKQVTSAFKNPTYARKS